MHDVIMLATKDSEIVDFLKIIKFVKTFGRLDMMVHVNQSNTLLL